MYLSVYLGTILFDEAALCASSGKLVPALKSLGGGIIDSAQGGVKNSFAQPTSAGYVDIKTYWTFGTPAMVCEVQFNTKKVLAVKNGAGHQIYESYRNLPAADQKPFIEKSQALYKAAYPDAKNLQCIQKWVPGSAPAPAAAAPTKKKF